MIREILFRAKTIHKNEWVQGTYHFDKEENEHYILAMHGDKGFGIAVNPDTVCQFTGLWAKDKMIFEKDIVRHFDLEKLKEVIFHNGAFGYNTVGNYDFISYSENKSNFVIIHDHSDNIEVVGNSIDNAELLSFKTCR